MAARSIPLRSLTFLLNKAAAAAAAALRPTFYRPHAPQHSGKC